MRQHFPFLGLCLATVVGGPFGCAPTRSAQLGMMFLPPATPTSASPATNASITSPELSSLPVLYSKASPNLLAAMRPVTTVPPVADRRVERADERFQAGKRLYQQGDLDGARREFDKAVDLLLVASVQPSADRQMVDRKMDEMIAAIYRYDIEGLGSGQKTEQPVFDKVPLEDVLDLTFPVDPKLKPRVKDEVTATASQLPLQVNDSVLSYINFFTSDRGRRTLIAGLRRAGKYRPMIQRVLAEEGVPQELIYLAQAESGFLPRAVSRAAAAGMWQFVRERGNQYDLHQSAYFDERYDPEKATRAAARHLKDLYQQFGDWHLAIAAYNCGPGCVDRAVQRTGYADYWELRARRAVPLETTNYVPIILAMTIMAKNAKDYGIDNIESEPALEYENVSLTAPVSLSLIADLSDRPVSELQDMNPALLGRIAPAGYQLHVPNGMRTTVAAALDAIPEGRRLSVRARRVATPDSGSSLLKPVSASAITSAVSEDNLLPGGFTLMPAATEEMHLTVRSRSTVSAAGTGRSVKYRRGTGRAASTTAVTSGQTRSAASSKGRTAAAAKSTSTLHSNATSSKRGKPYTTASLHRPH